MLVSEIPAFRNTCALLYYFTMLIITYDAHNFDRIKVITVRLCERVHKMGIVPTLTLIFNSRLLTA